MSKSFTPSNQGFTLIEVIVVIGVLSILATTMTPLVVKTIMKRRLELTETRLVVVAEALEDYYFDKKAFPPSISDSTFVDAYLPASVNGQYHKDPMVRYLSDLGFSLTSLNGQCTVYSRGEDGVDNSGSGDDIAVIVRSDRPGVHRTREQLDLIGVALQRYLAADPANELTGDWLASDRAALLLSSTFDRDGWGSVFQTQAGELQVTSPGPDRVLGTADDLSL